MKANRLWVIDDPGHGQRYWIGESREEAELAFVEYYDEGEMDPGLIHALHPGDEFTFDVHNVPWLPPRQGALADPSRGADLIFGSLKQLMGAHPWPNANRGESFFLSITMPVRCWTVVLAPRLVWST